MKNYSVSRRRSLLAGISLAILALATSCGGRGRSISDYKGATTGDSLLYYYAQLRAYEYMQDAENDTTMMSEESRKRYIDGVRAGIEAIREGSKNETYNRGVRQGARMAMRFLEFEENFNMDLDDDIFFEALEYRLAFPDSAINAKIAQKEFHALYERVRAARREADRRNVSMSLTEEARKHNLSKLRPDLYYRISRKGYGRYARQGDAIDITVDYWKENGENLGMPKSNHVIIGSPGFPEVLSEAYSRLNEGSTGVFATTAEAVFKSRAEIMGLDPSDLLIISATLNKITPDSADGRTNTPMSEND